MESKESLVGKKIGSLYVTSQKNSKVYCYCSNCGNNNIEYSYSKIMYYIRHNKDITCGCIPPEQAQITKNLIGAKYSELVILQQKDNEKVVCRCTCGELLTTTIDNLENKNISMCKKCMKDRIKKNNLILSNRYRKELYYIWIKFKELYNNPTPKFEKEIIKQNIKFFPTIFDNDNGFEMFYQWAIQNNYDKSTRGCYLGRKNHSKDFDYDNSYWTSSKSVSYYKFPKLNEEREKENYDFKVNTSYNYYYEDEEEKLEDSEPYYEDEEEDCEDIDINSEEFKRDLEMFRNLQKNKKI